jgi:L-lactate dehydrogenase complex protein LldG
MALLDSIEFPYITQEKDFEEGIAGLTSCEALVARTGSILVSSGSVQDGGSQSFPPPPHPRLFFPACT